ncbi:MAG: ATP-binding protein [Solirubrobacterales bacterium]
MIRRFNQMPVRWRIALASAAMTTVILIGFAVVVGRLATDRLHTDFDADVQTAALTLGQQLEVGDASDFGQLSIIRGPDLEDYARPQQAEIRVVRADGAVIEATRGAPNLGAPTPGLLEYGSVLVSTVPARSRIDRGGPVYIQYARSMTGLESTINRLYVLLAGGVLAAAALSGLAGLTIAGRAMAPISQLTSAAREIARSRDPSVTIPQPRAEDEVAELARTLDQMLRSLDEARAETEHAMERQREFVADASHELRTPLTAVLANLELLQESLSDEADDEGEMVDAAVRSSRRMSRLIADLLLLAQADAGHQSGRQAFDLGDVTNDAVAEAGAAGDGSHPVSVEVSGPVAVTGNRDAIHRLVVNLVENALRYTPPGTPVDIAVRDTPDAAVLEVADRGPGIPPEIADTLFERFVRHGGDRGAGGTGLGLAIVRAVVDAHGGTVAVDSPEQGGARFVVTLPAAPPTEPLHDRPAVVERPVSGPVPPVSRPS